MSSRNFLNIAKSICCSFIFRKMNKNKVLIIIIIAVVLISIGGAFIFFTHHPKTEKKEQVKKKTLKCQEYAQYVEQKQ